MLSISIFLERKSMRGLYIHIPFCEKRCHYCDFTTMVLNDNLIKERYLNRLKEELDYRLSLFPQFSKVDTIFIGGGTPTSLDDVLLEKLLRAISSSIDINNLLEYSIEANPNTLTKNKIKLLSAYGVNRVSLGVQSMDNSYLTYLGRSHSVETVASVLPMLREAHFSRINLDLMYGLPNMTLLDWQKTVKKALELEIDHLSLYQLKIEEGTLFDKWEKMGKFTPFSDGLAFQMFSWHEKYLRQNGFFPYEIANFAKAGQASIHNQLYWQMYDYLGFGLGATSFIRPNRVINTTDLLAYLEKPFSQTEEIEHLGQKEQMSESIFMGLRQSKGISKERFFKLYGQTILSRYPKEIAVLKEKGLLLEDERFYRLSEKGRPLANEVFMMFV